MAPFSGSPPVDFGGHVQSIPVSFQHSRHTVTHDRERLRLEKQAKNHFVYSTGGSVTSNQALEEKVQGQCQLVRHPCLKGWSVLRKPVKMRWQVSNAMSFSDVNIRQNGSLWMDRLPRGRGRGFPQPLWFQSLVAEDGQPFQ